jgi:hypothetical protein
LRKRSLRIAKAFMMSRIDSKMQKSEKAIDLNK